MSSSGMEVEFVELDRSRRAEVRSLILSGLEEHWGQLDPTLNPDVDDLLASYPDGRTVVAVRNGEVIGTGTIRPVGDRQAEIIRMSVAGAARRLGVGAQIVEELVDTARHWGCTAVVLETTSTWTEVVAFYQRCGFTITGTESSDFGEDTWFIRRL